MERITGLEELFVKMCIDFARQFLILPDTIHLFFDDCPSERFPSETNAAESNIQEIYLNKYWYHKHIIDHPANVAFFIFHELRHIHQYMSIYRFQHGLSIQDPIDTVTEWNSGFRSYTRNIDEETQEVNIRQSVEWDANAYGVCLMELFYQNKPNIDKRLTLPESIYSEVYKLANNYIKSKPELKKYISDHIKAPTQNSCATSTEKTKKRLVETKCVPAAVERNGKNAPANSTTNRFYSLTSATDSTHCIKLCVFYCIFLFVMIQ